MKRFPPKKVLPNKGVLFTGRLKTHIRPDTGQQVETCVGHLDVHGTLYYLRAYRKIMQDGTHFFTLEIQDPEDTHAPYDPDTRGV